MKNKFLIFLLIGIANTFLSGRELVDVIKEGVVYLNSGYYEKSIKILEEAKRSAPENPDIYYYLGEAYFRIRDMEKAITNLQKAIEINSQNQAYYYLLAHVYISQNKNKEALESLDKIIKISPLTYYGKLAKGLKEKLEIMNKEIEITKKWEKIEIEEKKKKEEKEISQQANETGETGEVKKEVKIPVDKLIKRIKFGTEDIRKTSSVLLSTYSSDEISQVIKDIIDIVKKEKNKEIRKNLIFALGKVSSPEVVDILLEIIKNEKELYEIKLVAFNSIENIKSDKIVPEMRNILLGMVDRREKEREEAKRNFQQISQQIENLTKRRDTLNSENEKMNSRVQEINSNLGIEETPEGALQQRITERERQKLNEEKRTLEEKVRKNTEEIQKINREISELEKRKNRYETLLALRERKIDISNLGSSELVIKGTPSAEEIWDQSGVPQQQITYSQTELDEERNEIILSIRIINFLADMRDKEALQVIKRGWKEFGVPGLSIYYYIALGKLGEYTNIDTMVSRLKRNYPQENLGEEINIRKDIVEVLGEYIKNKPNEEIKGLIEYLAEESEYPQIKNTAKKVLAKTGI
ncbi:MAG: tetratricopeptide repeat protein [Candidatus Omnitrophica bacterium]|nr:tetratricopeptide repeat protein [Candidatus Omnitrophota bacterium]